MVAGTDTAALRVEYSYDPESRNWCFVVPVPGIIGGAVTREEAEQAAREAALFTLAGESDSPPEAGSEVGYLPVTVRA
jgi:predicted RNase H-like HicB family nuclease